MKKCSMRQNFDDLVKIYSSRSKMCQVPKDFVNLCDLFTSPKRNKFASGAYFDDGSIFVRPSKYFEYASPQENMKVATYFVQSPSIRREHPQSQRLILLAEDSQHEVLVDHLIEQIVEVKDKGENNDTCRLLTRNV
ncbi:hypothetical protein P153DRAFT_187303 [Dothidotthia symphoricarpi CBS 119687]|uniref:Uncharacterized protein n=1 Tax=Dothidotthia symphoricarpi CBS 119687 TaxID=1392245 RepID=A0A6A6AMC1_9PLEO|nr:uncharacterized protein P153DRAFT_187303 [Dothidotthia symphoricarpi CBS 119687]KAF2132235.1 hypothetical protein P153DRAFT_187303 [Dothidotthia symphoricarpi CBS 119687]